MSRQAATGSRERAELFAFQLKSWDPTADPAELIARVCSVDGVMRAEFNPRAKRLIVLSTVKRAVLQRSLVELGLELEIEEVEEEQTGAPLTSPDVVRARLRERLYERLLGARDWLRIAAWVVPVSFLLGLILAVLATPSRPAPTFWLALAGAALVVIGLLFGGRRLLQRPEMAPESRFGRPDTALCLLVVVIALVLSGRWLEGLLLVPLYGVVQLLPGYVLRRMGRSWRAPIENLPSQVRVITETEKQQLDVAELSQVDVGTVEPGQLIAVFEGEVVPLDGRVHGESTAVVSRKSVTGEGIPSIPQEGELVPAGATVEAGTLFLRVERRAAESMLFSLRPDGLYQGTLDERLTGVGKLLVGRIPQLIVYGATFVMVVPPLLFGEAVGPWIQRGLAILLIAPVNSLLFALLGPVLGARTALANLGGAVESPDALAALGRATRLTLCHSLVVDPRFTLTRIEPLVQMGEADALRIGASFLAEEAHPWGAALAEAAASHGVELIPPLHSSGFDGEGLVGKLRAGGGTEEFAVGTTSWMQRQGVQLPADLESRMEDAAREGASLLWLAYDGHALAVFALQGRVKDGIRRLVQKLRKAGARAVFLLSNHEGPLVSRFAEQAGLDGGYGQLGGNEAAELIAAWHESGEKVASIVSPQCQIQPEAAEVTVCFDAEGPVAVGEGRIRLVTADISQLHPVYVLARRFLRSSRPVVVFVLAVKAVMLAVAWHMQSAFLVIGSLEAGCVLLVAALVRRLVRTG